MAKKRKKRNPLAALLDLLLSMIDWVCEGIANLCAAALRGLVSLVRLVLSAVMAVLRALLRAVLWPFMRLWRLWRGRKNRASRCLRLTGPEFESYVAAVLHDNGFRQVRLTKGSGDQGVDILAVRNGRRYAIQCKNYEGSVGNYAVQEAYAGMQHYGCDEAAVICPGEFTRGAKELAQSTGVLLWDGKRLSHMMKISGRRPRHRENA